MRERGVDAGAMEVSSHALALHRVDGCRFAGAAFTNLSQDHLDFHPTMEDYFEAKAALFDPASGPPRGRGGRRRPGRAAAGARDPTPCRFGRPAPAATPTWWAERRRCGPDRLAVHACAAPARSRPQDVVVPLPGDFNVSNALVALALLAETGTALDAAAAGSRRWRASRAGWSGSTRASPSWRSSTTPTRPAAVDKPAGDGPRAGAGRVLVVLGCGGDRDRGKRPLMGAAAVAGADVAVLTSDNPRSEDPLAILDAMARRRERPSARAGAASSSWSPTGPRRFAAAVARPGPATPSSSPARATRPARRSEVGVAPFDDRDVLRASLLAAGGAGSPANGAARPSRAVRPDAGRGGRRRRRPPRARPTRPRRRRPRHRLAHRRARGCCSPRCRASGPTATITRPPRSPPGRSPSSARARSRRRRSWSPTSQAAMAALAAAGPAAPAEIRVVGAHRLGRQDEHQGPDRPGARPARADDRAARLVQQRPRRPADRAALRRGHPLPGARDGRPRARPHRPAVPRSPRRRSAWCSTSAAPTSASSAAGRRRRDQGRAGRGGPRRRRAQRRRPAGGRRWPAARPPVRSSGPSARRPAPTSGPRRSTSTTGPGRLHARYRRGQRRVRAAGLGAHQVANALAAAPRSRWSAAAAPPRSPPRSATADAAVPLAHGGQPTGRTG